MLLSGINADSVSIPDGSPIAGRSNRFLLDRVVLAGGDTLAAGVATSGSVVGGVVSVETGGMVDLGSWKLATGETYLTQNLIYRLSETRGQITPDGDGQVIGLAVSRTQLMVSPSPAIDANNAIIAALEARIAALEEAAASAISAPFVRVRSIPINVDGGTVTGIGCPFIPRTCCPWVIKPVGGLNLWANLVNGTLSRNAFTYTLNGLTDSANYLIAFAMFQ